MSQAGVNKAQPRLPGAQGQGGGDHRLPGTGPRQRWVGHGKEEVGPVPSWPGWGWETQVRSWRGVSLQAPQNQNPQQPTPEGCGGGLRTRILTCVRLRCHFSLGKAGL